MADTLVSLSAPVRPSSVPGAPVFTPRSDALQQTEPGSAVSNPEGPRDPSNIRMADHIDRDDATDLLSVGEGLVFPPVALTVRGNASGRRAAEHEDPVSLGMLSAAEASFLVQWWVCIRQS